MLSILLSLWIFGALFSPTVISEATTTTNSSTRLQSLQVRVSQKLKDDVDNWRLCSDPRLKLEDNQFICFLIGGDRLIGMVIAFDEDDLTGKLRAVDPFNMSQTVGNAVTQMRGESIRTNNAVLAPPLPGNRYSTLNWTYADTAVYLEGFPCTGMTKVGPTVLDPMHQFRYGDVALALDGYLSVALNKRPANDNVALVLAWEVKAFGDLKDLKWDWFGWFTVQNSQAPYIKFSDYSSNVFTCNPNLQNGDSASGNGSSVLGIAHMGIQQDSPVVSF